jgi:hypothetical protein
MDNPLDISFFDDAMDLFNLNIKRNEDLYNELHDAYKNSQGMGFSLGTSKNSIELTKTLATLRSTALTGTNMLFGAKKALAELELKKVQIKTDEAKVSNDSEFIRKTLEEINQKGIELVKRNTQKNDSVTLDAIVNAQIQEGAITLSQNEKAMALDFKNMVEIVYDTNTETIKAVKKGTDNELKDYPIERSGIKNINNIDYDSKIAFCDNGQTIPLKAVISG